VIYRLDTTTKPHKKRTAVIRADLRTVKRIS
jgi:hypothetical protein